MFPNEIWIKIFSNLHWKEIILLTRVCKFFELLIKSYSWPHEIDLPHIELISSFVPKYQFENYNIRDRKITDFHLSYLSQVHTLNIRWCKKITDAGLKFLTGVSKLIR